MSSKQPVRTAPHYVAEDSTELGAIDAVRAGRDSYLT